MSPQIYEGTWEEIKRHEAELAGRHVRVIVTLETPAGRQLCATSPQAAADAAPHHVSALGKYAGFLDSEDFMRRKQEEIDREDRARS